MIPEDQATSGGLQLTIAAAGREGAVKLQGWAVEQLLLPDISGQQRPVLLLAPKRPLSASEPPAALDLRRFPALLYRHRHGICLALDLQYITDVQRLGQRQPRQWSKRFIERLLDSRQEPSELQSGQRYWLIDGRGQRQIVTIQTVGNNLATAIPENDPERQIVIDLENSYWQPLADTSDAQ